MKHRPAAIPAAAVLLVALSLLGGCDAFFTNIFETPVKMPSTSELETMSTDDIDRLAEDDSFLDQLAEDDEKKAAVLDNLDGKFDTADENAGNPADTPEEQEAAALYAEILLQTSGVFDIVNNAASVLLSDTVEQFEGATEEEMDDLIGDLILDLFGGEEPDLLEIEDMLAAVSDAWDAYEAIGAGLVLSM